MHFKSTDIENTLQFDFNAVLCAFPHASEKKIQFS